MDGQRELPAKARARAVERLLELLVPTPGERSESDFLVQTRKKFREKIESGALNERFVQVSLDDDAAAISKPDFATVVQYAADLLSASQGDVAPLALISIRSTSS